MLTASVVHCRVLLTEQELQRSNPPALLHTALCILHPEPRDRAISSSTWRPWVQPHNTMCLAPGMPYAKHPSMFMAPTCAALSWDAPTPCKELMGDVLHWGAPIS